jgi:hypothetical protein
MMLVTKLTFVSLAIVPVLLTLTHRSATIEAHDETVIEQPHNVRLDGVEALKLRMPFNDRFVAVQDQPPPPQPKPLIEPEVPHIIEAEPIKPHAVKVTNETTLSRTERTERHRHHERDHDICRGHGRHYYYKHKGRYWHCRR